MTLEELRALSPAEAMAAQEKAIGLPAGFFDKQWAAESGRGKNMLSPAGAEGHFQIMPDTRKALEKRRAQALNPSDFYEALAMAGDVMTENMKKFGNVADATRAYNAGWNPDRWNNPETNGYVAKVLGSGTDASAMPALRPVAQAGYPELPTAAGNRKQAKADDATSLALGMTGETSGALMDTAAQRERLAADQTAAAAVQTRKDNTTLADAMGQAFRDPRYVATWQIMDAWNRESEVPPAGWDYMANIDQIEKPCGADDDCRAYMRENVVGPKSMERAQAEYVLRQKRDGIYQDAGGFNAFVAAMSAGVMDPAGWVAGLGTAKLFQLGRVGHAAFAARGSVGAARASFLAESALGNMALEGLQDALGEVKGTGDYAMAAAAGALFAAPFARGVVRRDANLGALDARNRINEAAVNEQVERATRIQKENPTATPSEVARKMEAEETDLVTSTVQSETQSVANRPQAVPTDVQAELRVANGEEPANPTVAPEPGQESPTAAEGTQGTTQPSEAPAASPDAEVASTPIQETGNPDTDGIPVQPVTRTPEGSTVDIGPVTYTINRISAADQAVIVDGYPGTTGGQLLDALADGGDAAAMAARMLRENADQSLFKIPVVAKRHQRRDSVSLDVAYNLGGTTQATLDKNPAKYVQRVGAAKRQTIAHELVHVATQRQIEAFITNPASLGKATREAAERLQAVLERYRKAHPYAGDDSDPVAYASKDLHEFAAQAMTEPQVQIRLNELPGTPIANAPRSAWREFLAAVGDLLGFKAKPNSSLAEALQSLEALMKTRDTIYKDAGGSTMLYAPAQPAGQASPPPGVTMQAMRQWAQRMTAHAQQYMSQNPIDTKRLDVITNRIGGTSDGLILARSNNPIAQLVASLVAETTTGAAGRQSTVAVRSAMLNTKLVGNFRVDYEGAWNIYANRMGVQGVKEFVTGAARRQFNEKVYEEVLLRNGPTYTKSKDAAISRAADALEATMQRAANEQRAAGTLGSGNLPTNSRGYIPRVLRGDKIAAIEKNDPADIRRLEGVLSRQFQTMMGWEKDFADNFAPMYLERVRSRTYGTKGMDGDAMGGDETRTIRDILEDMTTGAGTLAEKAAIAMNRDKGLGHTRRRIAIDMLEEVRPGLRVLDFYETDIDLLTRSYARRTAGSIALSQAGIHGRDGVRMMRYAMTTHNPSEAEMNAFDRVFAEITGDGAMDKRVISAGATNLRLAVGLTRLGSLVFSQAMEAMNLVQNTGLRSLMEGVPALPRHIGDIRRMKQGQVTNNPLLASIDAIGGEIGLNHYKMVAPLDAPDARLGEYLDQPGLLSRLLRAGGHVQSKISGFRGLMAAQHRMAAEEITKKALRFVRDGSNDTALRDMGFSDDLMAALRAEMPAIAKWDANGRLTELDLTKLSDPRLAEDFVTSVHRGTSQIIQGTFAGERNAWANNDYINMLTQLRTFGITAAEKQWGRTRMNHGYAYAGGLLLGQLAAGMIMQAARLQLTAAGRADRDEYMEQNGSLPAMLRASMNYSSLTGFTGDLMEGLTGLAGGWGGDDVAELLGARQSIGGATSIVPAVGLVDSVARVASGNASLYTAAKQLPFANLWYLVPIVNLTRE